MLNKNLGFCDLSIDKSFDFAKLHYIEKLGYNTVAINTYIEESGEEPKKKKKGETKEKQDYINPPIVIPNDIVSETKLNILQRVTLEFSDSSISHKLSQSENFKKYDIVAVVPKTLQAFQYACGTLDVDIITFDPANKIPFKVSRNLYRQATKRGVFFELMYSPMLRDSTARKNIISTAHIYHAVGKSQHLIVSSGAENVMLIRDVHDVVNLGILFGLNNNQSLEVIRNNTRKVIVKANSRRCGKIYVAVSSVADCNDEQIKMDT